MHGAAVRASLHLLLLTRAAGAEPGSGGSASGEADYSSADAQGGGAPSPEGSGEADHGSGCASGEGSGECAPTLRTCEVRWHYRNLCADPMPTGYTPTPSGYRAINASVYAPLSEVQMQRQCVVRMIVANISAKTCFGAQVRVQYSDCGDGCRSASPNSHDCKDAALIYVDARDESGSIPLADGVGPGSLQTPAVEVTGVTVSPAGGCLTQAELAPSLCYAGH